MSSNSFVAYRERDELAYYTERNALFLAHEDVLRDASEYEFRKDYIYWSIGELACHLAQVGEEDSAVSLTERLLDETHLDSRGRLRTWTTLAEKGVKAAGNKLRESWGLQTDDQGNTILPEQIDVEDGYAFNRLLALYQFGDGSVLPYLHRNVENTEEDLSAYGVRRAVKIFEVHRDESSYELIKSAALRAREYVLNQEPTEKELSADDASDFAQILGAITSALTPSRSEAERDYAQADIALKYFAQSLLKEGDLQRADEIQSLMLSKFDNAWLNAQRFELGYDPDGTYLRAVKEYLSGYGADSSSRHTTEITDALVRGGDPEYTAQYELIYDESIVPGEVDTMLAADVLVTLYQSGDTRAHYRLVELLTDPEDAWLLIVSLEKMGLKNEAITIAKKQFTEQPSYSTGLQLLNMQYDSEAMKAVQREVSEHDRDLIGIVHTRTRHLGKLAAHIVEIEQKPQDQ